MKDLTTLRAEQKMTQQDLANKAQVSNLTICNTEQQRHEPNDATRLKIERVFGERVNWLLTLGLNEEAPPQDWGMLETGLRSVLQSASKLPEQQREQFVQMTKMYLKTFEVLIAERDILNNPNMLIPPDAAELLREQRQQLIK